jgi:UDP-glucuronate decarboxylase
MKYLVTGAAGFLGSHLVEELLKRDVSVVGIDNFLTGTKENIDHLLSHPKFEFFERDVTEYFHFDVDGIFNLACPASPIQYQRNAVETSRTNFLGALHSLELARKLGVKILQASTSEVYGDPQLSPQNEEYWGNVNPIGVRSCYDEGKRVAETLFFDFYRQYKTEIKVARIFNTYGPKMAFEDGRVVSNFVLQALNNQDITVYGKGNQTRSFCYVDDTIDGLIGLFHSGSDVTGPINIGNPDEFTILELAEKIIQITKSKSSIIHQPIPSDDPKQRRPDISKATETIGWIPRISLEEGLPKIVADFRLRLDIASAN